MFKLESRSQFFAAYQKIKSCSAFSKIVPGSIIYIGNGSKDCDAFKVLEVIKNSTIVGHSSVIVPHLIVHAVPYFIQGENIDGAIEENFYKNINRCLREIPFIKMRPYWKFLKNNIIDRLNIDCYRNNIAVPVFKLEFYSNILNECFSERLDMFEFVTYSNYIFGDGVPNNTSGVCYLRRFTIPTTVEMFAPFMKDFVASDRDLDKYRHLLFSNRAAISFSEKFDYLNYDLEVTNKHVSVLQFPYMHRKKLLKLERDAHMHYVICKKNSDIYAKEVITVLQNGQVCIDGSIA